MSIGFEIIEDSIVILRQKTVYKQVSAYRRSGNVYARACGGFVRLKNNGGTSHPDIVWEEMEAVTKIEREPKNGFWMEFKQ